MYSLCMCMYMYLCVSICVYVCVCVCLPVCMYMCVCVCIYLYVCVFTYVWICIIYLSSNTHTHNTGLASYHECLYLNIYNNVCMYVCISICMYVRTQDQICICIHPHLLQPYIIIQYIYKKRRDQNTLAHCTLYHNN